MAFGYEKLEFEYLNNFESTRRLKAWLLKKAERKEWFSERGYLQYLRSVKDFMEYINAGNPDQIVEMLSKDQEEAAAMINSWVIAFTDTEKRN